MAGCQAVRCLRCRGFRFWFCFHFVISVFAEAEQGSEDGHFPGYLRKDLLKRISHSIRHGAWRSLFSSLQGALACTSANDSLIYHLPIMMNTATFCRLNSSQTGNGPSPVSQLLLTFLPRCMSLMKVSSPADIFQARRCGWLPSSDLEMFGTHNTWLKRSLR